MMHLEKKHNITENTPGPKRSTKPKASRSLPEEEEAPGGSVPFQACSPAKKKKQSRIETFVAAKHTLKTDMLHMVCVSNVSLHQIVSSESIRRSLIRAYPGEPSPPKSVATLRNILEGEALRVKDRLISKLEPLSEKG